MSFGDTLWGAGALSDGRLRPFRASSAFQRMRSGLVEISLLEADSRVVHGPGLVIRRRVNGGPSYDGYGASMMG